MAPTYSNGQEMVSVFFAIKCATRRISPPQGTRKTYLYRCLKRRLGRSLRSKFYRRGLVSHREASSHQPIRTEGGSSGSAFLPNRLQKQSSPYRLRQHLGGGLHQQTGRHKISRTLCSNVENPQLVSPKQCHTQSETRTGFTQCNSGWPLKEEPDRTNRVVPISTDLQITTEQPLPCQPNIPEPPCLVSRSSALQEHGFSAEVAERITAPQRPSTRSIYASKWTVFQRWCTDKQVDFRNPSIGDICNFFWYLFNDLNKCPSTIEGYSHCGYPW